MNMSEEEIAKAIQQKAESWRGTNGGIFTIRAMSLELARWIISLLEHRRWQSMETAPQDGSEIILCDGINVCAGFWDAAIGAKRAKPGWFEECDRGNLLTARNFNAIKWVHLPKP